MNGLSANDVGVAGLSNRVYDDDYNRSGRWFNHGNFAGDGSATNANVVANRDIGLTEIINRNTSDSFINQNIASENQATRELLSLNNLNERFNSLERSQIAQTQQLSNQLNALAAAQAQCCCDLKAAVAAVDAKVECNQKVNEARQDGINQGKLDFLVQQVQ